MAGQLSRLYGKVTDRSVEYIPGRIGCQWPSGRPEFGNENLLHWIKLMAISKDLLEILVCPLCKAPVEMKPDQSGLKCVQCKRVYPIRDDIPVMLIDEAKIEE